MTWRYDSENMSTVKNAYRDENEFECNGVNYERDTDNGRCYRLESSWSLRPEYDGALVKRRISAKEYEFYRTKCLTAIEKHEAIMNL